MAKKKRTYPGEKSTEHIVERGDLRRISVPGGGEAYTGPGATRALKALDARAMTLDRSIIVGEDFDPTRPEDAALFAHEKLHVDRGSTEAGVHAVHDAEELAARAAEEVVLQRMMNDGQSATPGETPQVSEGRLGENQLKRPVSPALAALMELKAQGWDQTQIVDLLARKVTEKLQSDRDLAATRGQNSPGGSNF